MAEPGPIPVPRVKPGDVIVVLEGGAPILAAVIEARQDPEGGHLFVTEVGTVWRAASASVLGFAA